jgi:hypothetical protein
MEEETKQEQGGTEPTAKTYTEAEYNALQEQLTAMQSQLSTANETIQSYKDMDIDGIQASVAEYKQKWEQSEADRKAFEYQTRLGQYVKTLGLRDDIYEQHVANLLAGKNLQFDGDTLVGAEDVLKAFRSSHADAFQPKEPPAPFMGNTPGLRMDAKEEELRTIYGLQTKKG